MTTVLLDTHVVHWLSAEPERLSGPADQAIRAADRLAVATITWFELAWLAHNGRIVITTPVRAWLDQLARHVESVSLDPAIASHAVSLPRTFPGDPTDRIIYATALERGWQVVTKDDRLRSFPSPREVAVW